MHLEAGLPAEEEEKGAWRHAAAVSMAVVKWYFSLRKFSSSGGTVRHGFAICWLEFLLLKRFTIRNNVWSICSTIAVQQSAFFKLETDLTYSDASWAS